MSGGFVTEDGSPVVSADDFRAALLGEPVPATAPAAPDPTPAPTEAVAETPATPAPDTAPTETPAATAPPAETPDELATLRAELAAIRQEQDRQRGTYDNNTRQQREALETARREADELRRQNAEIAQNQTKAAQAAFDQQRAVWEAQVKAAPDGPEKTAARAWIDGQVAQHEAAQTRAEAEALRASLAPVVGQLQQMQQLQQLTQGVEQRVALIHGEGAAQLAAQVGAPVEEVRAYLQRPDVQQAYQRVFALQLIAAQRGQPVPQGLLEDLGNRDVAYLTERVATRREAEARQVEANARDLVASGATRADGGAGAGAPPKSIETFADVTTEQFAAAMGIRQRR